MFNFIIALVLFFIGIKINKYSFNNLAKEKIKYILNNLCKNFYTSILLGIVLTATIQSSSAMIIIVISLLESSLIKFDKALAIIFGANIGTTITAHIFTISFKNFYLLLLILSVIFFLFSLYYKHLLYTSITFFSFFLIFKALDLISKALNTNFLIKILLKLLAKNFNKYYYLIIIAFLITALIQSSSVFTALILKLTENNLIIFDNSVALIIGSNLGTCFTAFLASINKSKKCKYLALIHFFFNLYGVFIFLIFKNYYFKIIALSSTKITRQIANGHSIFNITTLIFILPIILLIKKYFKKVKLSEGLSF
ncbi:MAG: Na/Pi cotransporter family protein [Bacillota bacterium]